MGLYAKWLLPHVTDMAMRNDEATRYRGRIVPRAHGVVLEVGAGSGLNFAFYGKGVARVTALDPSPGLLSKARKRAGEAGIAVDFVEGRGDEIPLADHAVDAVVMTWTLCCVPDPARTLAEIRRVLRPEGSLWFAEHGLAPDASVARMQRLFSPLWMHVAGGCHLDRKMDALIIAAGFQLEELEAQYAKGPRILGYQYAGRARPGPLHDAS